MKRISILSVLILVLAYAFYQLYSPGDSCTGLIEFVKLGVLFLLTVIIAIIAITSSIRKYRKTNRKEELLPLFLAIGLMIAVGIFRYSFKPGDPDFIFSSREKLQASDSHILKFYSNNEFVLEMRGTDFGCTYYGKYIRVNDTIKVQRDLKSLTSGEFANVYTLLPDGTLKAVAGNK